VPVIETVKKWTPSPLTAILLALIAWLWFRPPADISTENRVIEPWSVQTHDGRVVSSASLKGRVVLVNFWATWCPYCRKENPAIEAYWKDTRARGFEVVAISVDDTPAKIAAWASDTGYRFSAAPTNPTVEMAFGQVSGVPTSFILDIDGHIRHRIGGQVYGARLADLIEPLLPRHQP
jgi:thiol-disulfide isomerase/thioredoxin